ncbi:MAG: NCS1 family nucleobase:cation symporter-1 [Actinomycetota bacterium]|jgi:NCS1 family nucleobase:cation symporter-1|nr:NCS1 family nucleobase:cation symporter-1 [Rubrobacter sp.]MDQ3238650.1 NCS1 family nucleobase:cation symporter-1 [Actinomycetota bacterium]MDQ3567751.1 NCS1 family nucleobase:cation symporter-1 [Actinomycetota bacterium]
MQRDEYRDLAINDPAELARIRAEVSASPLYNNDLAPTEPEERTWTTYNIAALWIGMSIVITTYLLASGLIAAGMNWWQALLTISLGNVIVLVPMLLNAHAGTKYGVPFPVFVRASFGVRGANFAAMARALVACGWFGIQTWLGGVALDVLTTAAWGGWANIPNHAFIAFFVFWAIQVVIILTGIEGVKVFESLSAPLLIGGSIALLIWGFVAGGGISNVFSTSAQLQQGNAPFWALFWPSLAANVGYWITLSLNIPDFTRYAKSQRSQVVGQAIGLPLTMTAFSFIGIAVTAATIVVFDEAIWDPVTLVTRLTGDIPALLILAMFVIAIAQISTNMAANVVSPSFDFSNLAPKYISFRMGGMITAVIGILSFPWLLLETAGAYIFTWLVGYGSLLGAIGAVMIVDYWIVRRRQLDLADLYKLDGRYAYSGGWNWRAITAVFIGVVPVLPGFFKAATDPKFTGVFQDPTFIESLYNYGLFFTFGVTAVMYLIFSMIGGRATEPATEPARESSEEPETA